MTEKTMQIAEGLSKTDLSTQTSTVLNKDRFGSAKDCLRAWREEAKMFTDPFDSEDDVVLFLVWLYSDSTETAYRDWISTMKRVDSIEDLSLELKGRNPET